jgi:WD40 repeat protein
MIDFSATIADRTRDFTRREWVFAEIDRWLADPDAPHYFIITGEPGIGKTAIAARLTQLRDLAAFHFCIARQADTVDPLNFARSLSQQLAHIDRFAQGILEEQGIHADATINAPETYGPIIGVQIENLIGESRSSATAAFNRIVLDPLKHLYAAGFDRQLVILVDALDEAVQQPGGETVVKMLAGARSLPQQVRFVLTLCPEGAALRHFEQLNVPHLLLETGREENLQDVRDYVGRRLDASQALQARLAAQKMARQVFIERVTQASRGNFLYLVWLLPEIADGTQPLDAPEALADGLDSLYRAFLRTRQPGQNPDRWRRAYRPVLGVLAAAQEPLAAEQLASFTGLDNQQIRDALPDLEQFLDPIGAAQGSYRLHHQSVVDFLSSEERAGEFWIDLAAVHRRIADYCRERYADPYGLKYLVAHLRRSRDWAGLSSVLTDFDFMEAKCRALSVYDLEADYGVALSGWEGEPAGRAVLQAIGEHLARGSHHIRRAPELLFPHLYNHLTWLDAPDGPIHALCQRTRRSWTRAGPAGWLRMVQDPRPAPPPWTLSLEGHVGSVRSVAVTPDGRQIVSGALDNTVKVWELDTGRLVRSLEGHTDWVRSVAITPDGRQVVSGANDQTIRVWDLDTGRLVRSLKGHTAAVTSVAITPDGRQVVSGALDNTVKVWKLDTGRLVRSLEGHTGPVWSVAVTPDCKASPEGRGEGGQQVISGSHDQTIKVWELDTGRLVRSLEGHTGPVWSVAVTPDSVASPEGSGGGSCQVVSGSHDQTIKVWDLGSGRLVRSLEGHTGSVWSVVVTPDRAASPEGSGGSGRQVVSGALDNTIKVWELDTGRLIRSLEGHAGPIWSVAVTPDRAASPEGSGGGGYQVVSGAEDQVIKVWELSSGRLVHSLAGHTGPVWSVAVTPDGRQVVSGSHDQTIKVWELDTGRLVRSLKGHTAAITSVAIIPDRGREASPEGSGGSGRQVVSGALDKTVKVWELDTGRLVCSLEGHTGPVRSVAVTPDCGASPEGSGGSGRQVVSGAADNTVKVWELSSGRLIRSLEGHTAAVTSVAITSNGRQVVSGAEDQTVKVWELGTGRLVRSLEGHTGPVWSVAVTPDGAASPEGSEGSNRQIVSGANDQTVKVWELDTGRLVRSLAGHAGSVRSVAVTPDGHQVVSGAGDRTVKTWELGSGRTARSLEGHTDWVWSVVVTPDGRQVISGAGDKTVKVWELGSGQLVRSLEGHTDWVRSVTVTPDGRQIVSGASDGTIKVWELDTGRLVRSLEGHAGSVRSVVVTPDGRQIVSGAEDQGVKVWELASGRLVRSLAGHMARVRSVAVTPDGQQIVSGASDGTIKVWELGSGQIVRSLAGHAEGVNSVAITPDGRQVVLGAEDRAVKVWDLASGRLAWSLEGHTGSVRSVAVTPDRGAPPEGREGGGYQVVSGASDGTVKVWELATGRCETLFGNDAPLRSLALSPDSRWLVCGDEVGRVWIFEWVKSSPF